ncbi:MAG: hypothetical protein H6918_10485 [Sphingomonadaceae bacterium]|nr:hypothetical protein [Sphingomonadaceae bacterium]
MEKRILAALALTSGMFLGSQTALARDEGTYIVKLGEGPVVSVLACEYRDNGHGYEWYADTGNGMTALAEGYICDGANVTEGNSGIKGSGGTGLDRGTAKAKPILRRPSTASPVTPDRPVGKSPQP